VDVAAASEAAAAFGGRPRRFGALVVAGPVVVADADLGGRPRRRGGCAGAAPCIPRIPSSNADNSAISSRTSARRAVRFWRFRFVAFSRRDARHVSSDFAAASANSSHSTWRANAAAGVIAVVARPPSEFPVDGAGESVIEVSRCTPAYALCRMNPPNANRSPPVAWGWDITVDRTQTQRKSRAAILGTCRRRARPRARLPARCTAPLTHQQNARR
jgi:hypothetical protein